jgi:hypothetical protein
MWLVRMVPFCRVGNGDAQADVGGEGFDVGPVSGAIPGEDVGAVGRR